MTNIKFTDEARAAIKSAITSHPDWNDWRVHRGLESRSMTKKDWLDAAEHLGLNIEHVIENAAQQIPLAVDSTPATNAEAAPVASAHDLEAILAPVADYVGAKVLADLRNSIAPVIADANKPVPEPVKVPVVKEIEKKVFIDAETGEKVAAPEKAIADATITRQDTAGKVFGMRHKSLANMPVDVWNAPDAPAIDDDFQFDPEALADALAMLAKGAFGAAWLYGPRGTGKTTFVRQIAARLGRPFVRIGFNGFLEPVEIIGGLQPDGKGAMRFAAGVFAHAIQRPGCIILLDEVTTSRPSMLSELTTILDDTRITEKTTGSIIERAAGVSVMAADNTNGQGDETGLYAGTSTMNKAFQDRFGVYVGFGYMSPGNEAKALAAATGLDIAKCQHMATFAALTRKAAEKGEILEGLSHRRLQKWADLVDMGRPSQRAFEVACLGDLDGDTRETVAQFARVDLDQNHHLIDGTTAPVSTENTTPENADAANQFDALSDDSDQF